MMIECLGCKGKYGKAEMYKSDDGDLFCGECIGDILESG